MPTISFIKIVSNKYNNINLRGKNNKIRKSDKSGKPAFYVKVSSNSPFFDNEKMLIGIEDVPTSDNVAMGIHFKSIYNEKHDEFNRKRKKEFSIDSFIYEMQLTEERSKQEFIIFRSRRSHRSRASGLLVFRAGGQYGSTLIRVLWGGPLIESNM